MLLPQEVNGAAPNFEFKEYEAVGDELDSVGRGVQVFDFLIFDIDHQGVGLLELS